ncbi:MAG: lectin-like protein [Candidatus Poribacteria bacterium]|nr:lectin-like protein [Candidatus Poribacteria bacterium]
MNLSHFRPRLTVLALGFLLLTALTHTGAAEKTSTLSGLVIDATGQPITEFPIALQSLTIVEGAMQQTSNPLKTLQTRTDATGGFQIIDIPDGLFQFVALPKISNIKPDMEVVSVEIGGLTFPLVKSQRFNVQIPGLTWQGEQEMSFFGGIPFYIRQAVHIKNIKITVAPRMQVKTQVILADGTPLRKGNVFINLNYRGLDGTDSGTVSGPASTDLEGYLVLYVHSPKSPIFCTVSVEYQGMKTVSEAFLLENGKRVDDIILQLNGTAVHILSDEPRPTLEQIQVPQQTPTMPDQMDVWVVNPVNGHAYKKIHCVSWEDARTKAIAEGAHLVSINNEAEQQWLFVIFGRHPFWIGLTRVAEGQEWIWTSGEPVDYTNWAFKDIDIGQRRFVFVGAPHGKWHIESSQRHRIGMALLEKSTSNVETLFEDK